MIISHSSVSFGNQAEEPGIILAIQIPKVFSKYYVDRDDDFHWFCLDTVISGHPPASKM